MKSFLSGAIASTYKGFQSLINLNQLIQGCKDELLEIDMSRVTWMDANMCASLGALLIQIQLGISKTRVELPGISIPIKNVLQKNGFLLGKQPDIYNTTIQYKMFERNDINSFKEYLAKYFVGKGLPDMSMALSKKFRESISELFENAKEHSQSNYVFACGQLFPKNNRLDFSIVDRGIGIRQNILEKLGLDYTPENAIKWALEAVNTTRDRRDGKPGGFGLKLIKEFIALNKGKIQIVSDAGYWCFHEKNEEWKRFNNPFPGTVVNIEINTKDPLSYRLASEVAPDEIW